MLAVMRVSCSPKKVLLVQYFCLPDSGIGPPAAGALLHGSTADDGLSEVHVRHGQQVRRTLREHKDVGSWKFAGRAFSNCRSG